MIPLEAFISLQTFTLSLQLFLEFPLMILLK